MKITTLLASLVISLTLMTLPAYSQVVCSLDELVWELQEDLADNGKLDCLRQSSSPNMADESDIQRLKREAADWTGDCSFEAEATGDADWKKMLVDNYGINPKKLFVDVNGEPVEDDFDDQADMCEIVRSLIANGKMPAVGEDLKQVAFESLLYLDSVGGDTQTQPIAVNSSSFADRNKWYILLDGVPLRISGEPKYKVDKSQ